MYGNLNFAKRKSEHAWYGCTDFFEKLTTPIQLDLLFYLVNRYVTVSPSGVKCHSKKPAWYNN